MMTLQQKAVRARDHEDRTDLNIGEYLIRDIPAVFNNAGRTVLFIRPPDENFDVHTLHVFVDQAVYDEYRHRHPQFEHSIKLWNGDPSTPSILGVITFRGRSGEIWQGLLDDGVWKVMEGVAA